LGLGFAAPIKGQAPPGLAGLPGESLSTARRLAAAARLDPRQQAAEAVDEYLRILEEVGNDLVPLDLDSRRHCVTARRAIQTRLAALPPDALHLYRERIDL